ncbi:YceD family protein [[Acholeplasma] multilocale]|uniref:YceD family protein n=1 Tax=[Acholeplasma] multilocale TaxID=264638 RepID=UPI00047B7D3D|nr:YceD family protein [[Acholeplasma] multilocale]
MLLSELKSKNHIELTSEILNPEKIISKEALIKKYLKIDYDIDLDYIDSIQTVEVNGVINFTILAIDARDGKEFEYTQGIDWNEEYAFDSDLNDNANLIFTDEFKIEDYVIEQINMNIPINLTINNDIIFKTGSGWKLLSEQQYNDSENEDPDPRWEKLSELTNEHK